MNCLSHLSSTTSTWYELQTSTAVSIVHCSASVHTYAGSTKHTLALHTQRPYRNLFLLTLASSSFAVATIESQFVVLFLLLRSLSLCNEITFLFLFLFAVVVGGGGVVFSTMIICSHWRNSERTRKLLSSSN